MTEETRAESTLDGTDEQGCGWEWDHTIIDLGGGQWQCRECGAEGWDEDEEEQ